MQNFIKILKGFFKVILFAIALLFLLLIVFCGISILMIAFGKGQTHTIYGNIKTDTPNALQITVSYTYDKGFIKNIGGDPSVNDYEVILPLNNSGDFYFDSDVNNPVKDSKIFIEQYYIHCQGDIRTKHGVVYKPWEHNYTLSCLPN